MDLGLSSSPLLPNNHNNVSKLLSNALALSNYNATNYAATSHNVWDDLLSVDSDGFPSWVSADNRRLLQSVPSADLVVAKDGSGNFRTVKEAIAAAGQRQRGGRRFVIRIKSGVYKENVEIGKKLKNIMLVGDVVTGDRFIARDITFRNTAGAKNHQAVALRSGSDLSAFYKCSFEGYQDTLYVHSNRQFYRECYIYGTVDFIFGNAAAVLQNCMIYARRPMAKQKITVTAQGRTDPNQNTGISIHNSRVMAGSDLRPVLGSFKTYLGRPWKAYSRTVVMQTFLDSLVEPAGWLEWDGDFGLRTLYYGEYRNTGPGSPTGRRVTWRGYRVISSANEAVRFSVGNFIAGRAWIPGTGVPFTAGL
ncbi:Pectinesterase 2 [Linum perenne]